MSTQGIMKKTPSKDDLFRGWELEGHEPYDEGIGDGDDYGDDDGYPANSYSQQFHRVKMVIMIKAGR